jgi:hypothetical protein
MRYTRYEYKKSSRIKFLCNIAIIIVISIGVGLYISNFIFDGKYIQNNKSDNAKNSTEGNYQGEVGNFIALQCGYYSKEENAKELLASISKYCEPFIVEDSGKYRVLAGIYKEEDCLKKLQELKSNNIDVAKVNLGISSNNEENKKIIEITDGLLTIVGKLQDSEVKSIKTTEFKEWADKILNDDISIKTEKIDNLSIYVKNLPDEVNKTNSNENMQELYKLIKN